jgi:hypothetical protein
MRIGLVLALCALSEIASAEGTKLSGNGIRVALSDKILIAGDGRVEQIFQASGQTVYIEGGNASQGTWFVENDKYCSRWPPGNTATCYDVLQDGTLITFVSSGGKTYPMILKPQGE